LPETRSFRYPHISFSIAKPTGARPYSGPLAFGYYEYSDAVLARSLGIRQECFTTIRRAVCIYRTCSCSCVGTESPQHPVANRLPRFWRSRSGGSYPSPLPNRTLNGSADRKTDIQVFGRQRSKAELRCRLPWAVTTPRSVSNTPALVGIPRSSGTLGQAHLTTRRSNGLTLSISETHITPDPTTCRSAKNRSGRCTFFAARRHGLLPLGHADGGPQTSGRSSH